MVNRRLSAGSSTDHLHVSHHEVQIGTWDSLVVKPESQVIVGNPSDVDGHDIVCSPREFGPVDTNRRIIVGIPPVAMESKNPGVVWMGVLGILGVLGVDG